MFGKPEWFQTKVVGWGLQPKVWQGWAYSLAWMGVMAIPFAAMISRRQVPEACIWLALTWGMLIRDVSNIRQAVRRFMDQDVLYIGDDGESCTISVAARGGRLQPRS
jgi:hypothetical protein